MQRDPKTIPDGWVTLIGGQDSGKSASLIRDDQASELWNMTVRGGYPTNRPGFKRITLAFATNEIEEWFTENVHQGSIVFKPYGQQPIQVWSVGGRIFTVDVLMGGLVSEITPRLATATTANFTVPAVGASVTIQVADGSRIYAGYPIFVNGKEYQVTAVSGSTLTATNTDDTPAAVITAGAIVSYLDANSSTLTKTWMIQADRFLIIQDGLSQAIIFDGGIVRRADPARLEVPTGTVMAYGLGRLWVAINDREFVAGDIIYGPTGTPLYNYADAILHFTENTFLAEGGAFSLPFEAGKITAMEFMPVWDTSTGQGPLMVFTESSATSVDASPARETWKNITSPVQAVSMRGPGPKGNWSTVPIVNGDIFFRSIDGIRSLALAVRGWGDWGSTPISTEMDSVLKDDDEAWLFWTSAIVFDNRLLMTTGNRPGGQRPKFNGIAALDFHVISAMGSKSPPVYDGAWTGLSIWQLFKGSYEGKERAFAAVSNPDGLNELWEISKANRFDGDEGRIVSSLISRNLFNKAGFGFKRLFNCEIWVDDIVGTVDFSLYYRSDQYPCWTLWNTARVCVEFHNCVGAVNCSGLAPQYRPGYKTRIGFGQPADGDENNDAKPIRIGYEFQILLRWEGKAKLRKMRIKAIDVDEQPNPDVGVITVGCSEPDPELIGTPEPEPEPPIDDMPLNNAVYDASRDVIFAVRGGFIFKLNAATGERISYARYSVPDFDDTYLTLAPNVDKIYATYWNDRKADNDLPVQGLFRINPDTLVMEQFIDVDTSIDDEFASGPFSLEYSDGFVWAIYQNNTGESFGLLKFDPTSDTVISNTSVDGPATRLISQIAVNTSNNSLAVVRRTTVRNYNTTPALQFTTGTFLNSRIGYGLAFDQTNGQYYVVTGTQYVAKGAASSLSVFTEIDTGITDATPRRARWNSVDGKIYIAGWKSNSIIIIDPSDGDSITERIGYDSPYDIVFTPAHKWAVQHGLVGLKEIF